ncbi:TetR family transcriptional regulator (plasmid) [Methylocystis sp. MJC1]|uniref:TetR/AcrR family transcriptional regulator n=1 Tax=Methylocystis sp. MJC1 TaxID=2654282 RepID=UPI0013ED8E20|nr:TetR/AcrR family transcriptional regulator [Methylocystis sp. MJC1]KAF2989260.1 Tetracycline repressor protein class H [Methylocystis sp. MJC1]MBU6529289.1 TetR family transcriptional regulator [Methylocystis sp. MJC1]UZX14152.1 TetR family transcriptional regulator [Methylocystis sp. MJC1]
MSEKLNKRDWIDAAFKILIEGGVEAVRVERLAAALGVTKGSFYWHCKDRGALLDALLEVWQSDATHAIIENVEAKGGDARAKLAALFAIVAQVDGRLDRAIRGWAARDSMAADALEKIDRRRQDYLEALFLEMGFSPEASRARARLVYRALVGKFMMGATSTSDDELADCLNILLPMLVRGD